MELNRFFLNAKLLRMIFSWGVRQTPRYSIVAILEGFNSQDEYEEQFESKDGHSLDYTKLEEWFYKSAEKHKDIIGWWLDLDNKIKKNHNIISDNS